MCNAILRAHKHRMRIVLFVCLSVVAMHPRVDADEYASSTFVGNDSISYFGTATALGDGIALIHVLNQSHAEVFVRDVEGWTESEPIYPTHTRGLFGLQPQISGDVLTLTGNAESDFRYVVYVYRRVDGEWQRVSEVRAPDNEEVAGTRLSDGRLMVRVAEPFACFSNERKLGRVFLYRDSGGQWLLEDELIGGDVRSQDFFGISMDIDGDTAVVGATDRNSSCSESLREGAAYVFREREGSWPLEAKLQIPSGRRLGDGFGVSVGISGPTLVIGADGRDLTTRDSGAVYVYERRGSNWGQPQILKARDTDFLDRFGIAVSIDGATILIGSEFDNGRGAAYLFRRRGGAWVEQVKFSPSPEPGRVVNASGNSLHGDTVIVSDRNANNGRGEVTIYEPTDRKVYVGAGIQRGRIREDAELVLSFDSRELPVASAEFSFSVDPSVWTGTEENAGVVTCEVAGDLVGLLDLNVTRSGSGRFTVRASRIDGENLPRDGLIGYCDGVVSRGIRPGRAALPCVDGSSIGATDEDGTAHPTVCEDGEFELLPCVGDCDGSGAVTVAELVGGVRSALDQRDAPCSAVDRDGDGRVSIEELVRATGNALSSPC